MAATSACIPLEGNARTTCEADLANRFDNTVIQNYCALQSNVYLARDVNTVKESEQLAQENKERVKQAGGEEEPAVVKSTTLHDRLLVTKDGKIPLPPSRPSFRNSGGSGGTLQNRVAVDDPAATDGTTGNSAEKARAKAATNPSQNPNQSPNKPADKSTTEARKQSGDSDSGSGGGSTKADSNSVYDNVSLAQSEAQMDVQSCQSKQNSASLCCNNPLACASAGDRDIMQKLNAGPGDDAGMTQYCQQMQNASKASGSINGRLAATCTNNQYACSNSCASLEQKYRGYMANCENCESYSVFMNAANQLASARNSCGQLQARGDQLTAQSMNSASTTAYSQYCQQQAGMSPQSLTPQQAAAKSAAAASRVADQSVCAYNPAAPGCAQAAALNAAPEKGQGSFGSANKPATKNSFNPQDLADSGFPGMKIDSAVNPAPTVRAVPNGGGGGFGGMGGSGGGAQLGSSARPNRAAGLNAGPSPSTDIEQGFRSGGGYTQPSGGGAIAYEPSGYDGDRNPRAKTGSLDLKQYLPGGSLAPVRRLAGTNLRSEINAKEEDLFRRISLKIYEKCRLGILWRCD